MNDYLGRHIDIFGFMFIGVIIINFYFIRNSSPVMLIIRKILNRIDSNIKCENLIDTRLKLPILLTIGLGLALIIYPIWNLLEILVNCLFDESYDFSSIIQVETSRNFIGMRVVACFTGLRLLNLAKLSLYMDIDKTFERNGILWYLFVIEQYSFYVISIVLFFSLNGLENNSSLTFLVKNIEVDFQPLLFASSWAVSFLINFIIDDWRIISEYMINSGGLVFQEQLNLIRRFNYFILVSTLSMFLLNINAVLNTELINPLYCGATVLLLVISLVFFLILEVLLFSSVKVVDVSDFLNKSSSISVESSEIMDSLSKVLMTRKAVKFISNAERKNSSK